MTYKQLFGSGPTGIFGTVLIWIFVLNIGRFFQIPPINMNETFRWALIIFFIIDAAIAFTVKSLRDMSFSNDEKLTTDEINELKELQEKAKTLADGHSVKQNITRVFGQDD